MHPVRRQRLLVVLAVVVCLSIAVGLAAYALSQNINLFFTPDQVASHEVPINQRIRVGGLVVPGSVTRNSETLEATFDLTDGKGQFTVYYQGILPDLFREGQGIVGTGKLVSADRFEAEEILAKHDENYMPPEVQHALDEAGHPMATPEDTD